MARALASKGRQTLETLVINTKLPQNDVKLALLTLLFHRYVLQREHGEKKGRKQVAVEYEFVSSMVLQRLHYPMYIHMVRNTFGEIESLIFEKLLWNGRRRGSDLVLDVEGILFPEVDDENASENADKETIDRRRRDLDAALGRLREAQLITSNPTMQMLHCSRVDAESLRVARSINPHNSQGEEWLNAIGVVDEPEGSGSGDETAVGLVFLPPTNGGTKRPAPGKSTSSAKRAKLSNLWDAKDHIPYRAINYSANDPENSGDPFLLVDFTKLYEQQLRASCPVSEREREREHQRDSPAVAQASEMQLETIQAAVLRRFHVYGLRIFNILLSHQWLEQKTIGERALLPGKDARALLYRLLSAKLVRLQEIPRSSDHAPRRTYYVFGVSIPQVATVMSEECAKSILSLFERAQHELATRTDSIVKHRNGTELSEEELQSLQAMLTHVNMMETTSMRLAEEYWKLTYPVEKK